MLNYLLGQRAARGLWLPTLALALLPAVGFAQDLAGHWSGRMEPTRLSAEISLELRRPGSAWQAELSYRAGPDSSSLPAQQLRIHGDSVLISTKLEGADLILELALQDGLLLGTARALENGRVLAEGPAGLARASDAAAQARLLQWLNTRGESIDAARRTAVTQRALELLVANYVSQERAERAAAEVRSRAKAGEYDSAGSPARFAELLARHLSEATGDRHIHVKFGAEKISDPLSTPAETPKELAQLRAEAQAEHYGIGKVQVLSGNVGYLELTRFFRAELAGDALAAAMRKLAPTDALIVDVRACHGGDPVMVVLTASWLFDGRPRHWNDMIRRLDGTANQYWTAAWLPGARYVNKPVYVLTAERTFSAPESFAYELQQTRRATIVGEVTGGGAHSGSWFPVDDRFSIFIPLSRYVSAASGGDWEGVGVKPDVACGAQQALARAHRLALQKLGRK